MENNKILNLDGGTVPNIHSEEIKEEFYKWFESRGLLAELRAYMRQLMVRALEENNQNGKKKWQKKYSTSPKLQAINLLVVDYLFHENYFYTVSVFASEAHIMDSLPQYSRYVTQSVQQRRWDPDSLPRFSQQETEDILDTLHLPPTRQQLKQAVDCYLTGRDSLLACIVRTMVPLHSHSSENVSVVEEEEMTQDHSHYSAAADVEVCYQLWSQEMQQLLLMAGLKLTHINRMQHKWAQTIENERRRARKEAEEEYAAREAEWQRVVEEQLREERSDLRERQSQVEVREQSLANLAEHLNAVHEDITKRLSQLQLQSDQMDERSIQQENEKYQLLQKMRELKTREENLKFVRLNQNESYVTQPQTVKQGTSSDKSDDVATKEAFVQVANDDELGKNASTQTISISTAASTQTLGVTAVASTQTVDTEDHELQTSLEQNDPELVGQLEQARRKISEVQEENLELRAHILQQRQRIDELTNRAANLSSQLEDSQVAVAVLSGRESGVVVSAPTPPAPPPVLIAPTFGFRAPQRQGGGEESLFVPRPQQATPRTDPRRRPLRYAFSSQQPSPTSEESSPTDDVIQNARARIQQLEQESVSIQRNFQDFQSRLFSSDSLMFPPLRPPRTSDGMMRVRRADVGSSFPSARFHYTPPPFDNINRLIRNRQQYEEQEDSSSEFYDAVRIESLPNSRRLFTQRNIRHYERWKQFKKKFQKREGSDYCKRNFKHINSNTSSEDDDVETRNFRRRLDTNHTIRNLNTQVSNNQDGENNDVQDENVLKPLLSSPKINKDRKAEIVQTRTEEKEYEEAASVSRAPICKIPPEKVICSIKDSLVTCPSKPETQIGIDLKRSAKLIESVKVLLEAQSIKESGGTTLSSGSLAVESLPRDSVNNSQVDVGRTDSSFITVKNVSPDIENETLNTQNKREKQEENNTLPPTTPVQEPDPQSNFVILGTQSEKIEKKSGDNNNFSWQESSPEKLNTKIPSSNVEIEEITSNIAATSSDVAEVESGDRGTSSLTSGSDIIRELNPSKSDSSSSVLSAGFGDDSKQSSDFWD